MDSLVLGRGRIPASPPPSKALIPPQRLTARASKVNGCIWLMEGVACGGCQEKEPTRDPHPACPICGAPTWPHTS